MRCRPFSSRQVTIMSNRGNCGWGRFPSYSIIMVFRKCQCKNWTRNSARPRQVLTGKFLGTPGVGKTILYVHGSPPVDVVPQCHIPPVSFPCCVCRWNIRLPATPTPSPTRTPNTVLSLAVSTGSIIPGPSCAVCMPPPTGCALPDTDVRPFKLSS